MEIATFAFDWKVVGRRLLDRQTVEDIDREGHNEQEKRDQMFDKWLRKKGSLATYRVLMDVLRKVGNIQAEEAVEKLASSTKEGIAA